MEIEKGVYSQEIFMRQNKNMMTPMFLFLETE